MLQHSYFIDSHTHRNQKNDVMIFVEKKKLGKEGGAMAEKYNPVNKLCNNYIFLQFFGYEQT